MRKKLTIYSLALLGMLVLFNSCKKEYEPIENIDEAKIQAYIAQNDLTVTKDDSGFYYQVSTPGTGPLFKNSDWVLYNINVTGLDGTLYLSSPLNGNLGAYVGYTNGFTIKDIPAIRTAILKLSPGGTAKVILPSYLAFGKNGSGNIPPNEVVVLDITTYDKKLQSELDDDKIENFLTAKGITAIKDPSRVYYQILTEGTGTEEIDLNSTLVVKYAGRFLDGTVFDSSDSFSTTLLGVIAGWGKVIPKFRSGSKIRIFIPSDLGYGTTGNGPVPGNAVLDFDIEIVSVTNAE